MEMDSKRGWSRMEQTKFIDIGARESTLNTRVKQVGVVLILYSGGQCNLNNIWYSHNINVKCHSSFGLKERKEYKN